MILAAGRAGRSDANAVDVSLQIGGHRSGAFAFLAKRVCLEDCRPVDCHRCEVGRADPARAYSSRLRDAFISLVW